MTEQNTTKKVNLNLVGLNGNAFSLMSAFTRKAKDENWTQKEIDAVISDCQCGDYDHLLQVLIGVTKNPDGEYED